MDQEQPIPITQHQSVEFNCTLRECHLGTAVWGLKEDG